MPTRVTAPPAPRPSTAGTGPAPRPSRLRSGDDRRVAWLFLLPVLVGFAVFYLYPTARGIWYSVTDYSMLHTPAYVGAAVQLFGSLMLLFWYVLRLVSGRR